MSDNDTISTQIESTVSIEKLIKERDSLSIELAIVKRDLQWYRDKCNYLESRINKVLDGL